MIRLSYVSTLNADIDTNAKEGLIANAAAANRKAEIGGVIAFDGQRVCQILEGEREKVLQLFASISRDPRHSNVFELDRAEVDKRLFHEWGMVKRSMSDMVMYAYSILP